MQVTTTITVEIKGQKHELTKAEAEQLRNALAQALGPVHQYSPMLNPALGKLMPIGPREIGDISRWLDEKALGLSS